MKFLIILNLLFLTACHSTKVTDELCAEWTYLKYPVLKKGYIGENAISQGEICYQRKWKSYVGLSKSCIVELLGEPAKVEKNEFLYYFSNNPLNQNNGATGVLHLYFRNGIMKKMRCGIA